MNVRRIFPLALLCCAALACRAVEELPKRKAGLLVHVGCGTGDRTIQLAEQGNWLVHALETDTAKVDQARKTIRSRGLYGRVAVEPWAGRSLPYADDIVSVLIVEDYAEVSEKELLRVLIPGGYIHQRGKTIIKPWPKEIDNWSHQRHGADGNPVSKDTVVALPQQIRWLSGMSSRGSQRPLISQGTYCVNNAGYDAFTGLLLWTGKITPVAAGEGKVFGYSGGKVIAVDVATGEPAGDYGSGSRSIKEGTLLYLVCLKGNGLKEYTPDGKVVWQPTEKMTAFAAFRRPDGTTVVSCLDSVREFDKGGRQVWA